MECNFCLNYICVVLNVMCISSCFASNLFESAPIGENQGFIYNSVHKRSLFNNESDTRSSTQRSFKKWQVGRVSRKHYEIINMLWRKTKVFVDVETATEASQFCKNGTRKCKHCDNTKHVKVPFKSPRETDEKAVASSSTPSFIEFYYFDENDDMTKLTDPKIESISNEMEKIKTPNNIFKGAPLEPQSPRITFHANDPNFKPTALTLENIIKNKNEGKNQRPFPIESWLQSRNDSKFENLLKSVKLKEILGNRTLFGQKFRNVNKYWNGSYKTTTKKTRIESTTVYDKVKFFELYDKHTYLYATSQDPYDAFEKSLHAKDLLNDEKNDLVSVDQNIGHSNNEKSKLEKKHITILPTATIKKTKDTNSKESSPSIKPNIIYEFRDKSAIEDLIKRTRYSRVTNTSRLAYWSSYPFVAVYVYEPTHTHCDAAGISPHWLIAAGACLSRHHMVHSVGDRSAFVIYCGDNWRKPERIAYVKYSLVHPKFNPRNKATKHNYNIGLIQVSSSMMSSCRGWAPVPLMSYQFTASPEGSLVSALGWGLDRYGRKYLSKRLPPGPLMVYDGLVYSDSCPGSAAYSKAKQLADRWNNVFCLLLPPYLGEAKDPVHGGLLIDRGKLIAVYLQEERRRSGPQSAQYTGVWRLLPWVVDVAREPEDLESFRLDM